MGRVGTLGLSSESWRRGLRLSDGVETACSPSERHNDHNEIRRARRSERRLRSNVRRFWHNLGRFLDAEHAKLRPKEPGFCYQPASGRKPWPEHGWPVVLQKFGGRSGGI